MGEGSPAPEPGMQQTWGLGASLWPVLYRINQGEERVQILTLFLNAKRVLLDFELFFRAVHGVFLWGTLNSVPPANVKATSSLGTGGELEL